MSRLIYAIPLAFLLPDLVGDARAQTIPSGAGGDANRPVRPGFEPTPSAARSEESDQDGGEESGDEDEPNYKFSFEGFMRIPFRMGFGESGWNSPPHIPDESYTDWQYTNQNSGAWTELYFGYGDKTVNVNVSIAAYDVAETSYRNLQAQLGISQSFLRLNFPTVFGDTGGLRAKIGAFVGRYGMSGEYDAGHYDTYLFGASRVAGETLAADLQLTDRLTLTLEHGFGAKLDVPTLVTEPAGFQDSLNEVPYLPYPGDVQQGSTFLNHAHAYLVFDENLTVGLHHMYAFTNDADKTPGIDELDGSIQTFGAEVKLLQNRFGNLYLGYARLISKNPLRLASALETIHSFEGWNLRDNYFGESSTGNGTIDTVLWDYTFSLSRFFWHPQPFWGQGPDLQVSFFGMLNLVSGDDNSFAGAEQKLKLGGELYYQPLSWVGFGFRYDLVQPNMDDNTLSFSVLSPRIVFSSRFASNEQVVIQYQHYLYGDNVKAGWPYDEDAYGPDPDTLRISAVMWW